MPRTKILSMGADRPECAACRFSKFGRVGICEIFYDTANVVTEHGICRVIGRNGQEEAADGVISNTINNEAGAYLPAGWGEAGG